MKLRVAKKILRGGPRRYSSARYRQAWARHTRSFGDPTRVNHDWEGNVGAELWLPRLGRRRDAEMRVLLTGKRP